MWIWKRLKHRWSCDAGYRDLLVVAIPLILSTSSWAIQHFVDRMFLTWYSPETVAASMPAGMLNFMIMSLFIGTAEYVSTFVAQYYGAGRPDRIGPALWQGMYLSVIGGAALLAFVPLAEPMFAIFKHDPLVQQHEVAYFQILCLGAFPAIASAAMSGLFSGLGKPWPVMWVNLLATAVNVVFDYAMIFGKFGFPEWGIRGAAIATVMSACTSCTVYFILFCRAANNTRYHTLRGWRFERDLFKRLLRFGIPNGVQFFLDMSGFTIFVLLLGRLGTTSLAATNIAFNINTLAFMPTIGIGIAVSVLVGQHLGNNRADLAEYSAYSGFHLAFGYMTTVAALYVLTPGLFMLPYAAQSDPTAFEPIRQIAVVLLRFVAIYSLFDSMAIIFASAIKGAGDTHYIMLMNALLSVFVFILPSYIGLVYFQINLYLAWGIASTYIVLLNCACFLRFWGGKWQAMRVIEEMPFPASALPENPVSTVL